jgi:hypothetical protein
MRYKIAAAFYLAASVLAGAAAAQSYPHDPQTEGLNVTGANWGVIYGQGVITLFASPPCAGCTVPGRGAFTTLSGTTTPFADRPRTLQSFGAVGDGITDDTSAVQTALNSGIPLTCRGTFRINSLITITNVNVFMAGADDGCALLYNTSSAMIYASLTGASAYGTNYFTFQHVKLNIGAVITAVAGAPHTAALDIEYPLGTNGVASKTATLDDVQAKPTASTNYILNGLYLNEATNAWISNFVYEGERAAFQSGTAAIVYDGTHAPTNLHVLNGYADFAGIGVYAPQQSAKGWQGIRITGFDCVYCETGVKLFGALDGLSDYADLTGVEGAFESSGILSQNVGHVLAHDNYLFLADMPIPGGAHALYPHCLSITYSVAIPVNGAGIDVSGNACDGGYGIALGGMSGAPMASVLGQNMLTNLDFGFNTAAGTAGWVLNHQSIKNVTTEWSNNSTPGANQAVPPLWEPLTTAQLPACNAAAKGQQRLVTDALAPTYNGALTGGGAVTILAVCDAAGWKTH